MPSASGSKRSTIRDVAAEAEVAISTVSLVMNEKGYVSEDTRTRVQEAARRLGYVPRQAARRLASQRTGNVGFVLRKDHFTRGEPFYTHVFLGTEFEADLKGLYVLLTTIPKGYVPGQHTPRFLRERNIDGLLIAGKVAPAFLEEVALADLPAVLIDFERVGYPSVVIDNRQGGQIAVDHLLARGHRRIAFLGADLEHPSLSARLDGYRLALGAAGVPFDPGLILTTQAGEPTRETGTRLADQLFRCDPRPTAAFCVNDAVALGVLDRAWQQGIAVPRAIAVVGFDDVLGAANATPALSTVRVFKEQLGELALRYLYDVIEGASTTHDLYERSSHTIRVPAELIARASS